MLHWIAVNFMERFPELNLFRYITFRAIVAVLVTLGFSLLIGKRFIQKLGEHRMQQQVRDDGPKSHHEKAGTPTMGGLLILISLTVGTLICADWGNRFIPALLITVWLFGAIGWLDDHLKHLKKQSKGLAAKSKFLLQIVLGIGVSWYLMMNMQVPAEGQLFVPLLKSVHWNMGWWFVVFSTLVIVGSSNAVNLTDGLDGLAIAPTIMVSAALAIFAYLSGHLIFSDYLNIPYIPGLGEVAVFCAALAGSGLGFLWYNTYPAQVFMGDVGSLALGSAIGMVAVLTRQEIVLAIMGGLFVVETLSVILQVFSYKTTGQRIFRMAPLHHHFEMLGWPEPRVIVRFWIISLILVLAGLATLKVR